jgi:hypothetical protein
VLRIKEDVPARQAITLCFEGKDVKGISVQFHLYCQIIIKKHFIWVVGQNLMKQLLRWRKIGYSGIQLMRA